jgi:hypothetical protein
LQYSGSAQKFKQDLIFISGIKPKSRDNAEKHEEEEDDINLSELGTIKDDGLSEWDKSQLDLQHSGISRKS